LLFWQGNILKKEWRTMIWPVADSFTEILPRAGEPGSFWEDRGDRRHCGVDIYAPLGSIVQALEDGKVLETGVFTTARQCAYWSDTFYVLIQHVSGVMVRYAELAEMRVIKAEIIKAGSVIGAVGRVLDVAKIDDSSPAYIQRLKKANMPSMLHFEFYAAMPNKLPDYLGGNWFAEARPDFLLDPCRFLNERP
jgi:murein DD-endopeptidase MepM/ murein hydrolase activator NlpD